MTFTSLALSFLLHSPAFAAPAAEARQLFFPIEKNSIQILPQRFEYQLLSPLALRVGDDVLNAGTLSFQFAQPHPLNDFTLARFRWSGALFSEGDIVLLDSTGKALWRHAVSSTSVRRDSTKRPDGSRLETLTFEDREFPASVLSRIRLYPFFRFCLSREEDRTHVLFCARDQYLKLDKNKKYLLRSRTRPGALGQIEINGQAVDPQGYIFLEGVSNPVNLHASFPNGASLDIETRQQKVEFRDVTRSEDGKRILIKAVGAEPADPRRVRKTGEGAWVAEIESERPHLYVKGAAGIPMKQEFVLSGPLRPNDLLLTVEDDIPTQTYASDLALRVRRPQNWKPEAGDKSRVSEVSDSGFTWTLENLAFQDDNRRFLKLTKEGQSFFAAAEIKRYRAHEYQLWAGAPLEAGLAYTRWLEGFRWGVRVQAEKELMKMSENNPQLGRFGAEALWTLNKAILDVEPQTGLSLGVQNAMIESQTQLALALGAFTRRPARDSWLDWGDTLLARGEFAMGQGSGSTKLKSLIGAELLFEKAWTEERRWLYGAALKSTQVDFEGTSKNLIWISVRAGISGIF